MSLFTKCSGRCAWAITPPGMFLNFEIKERPLSSYTISEWYAAGPGGSSARRGGKRCRVDGAKKRHPESLNLLTKYFPLPVIETWLYLPTAGASLAEVKA